MDVRKLISKHLLVKNNGALAGRTLAGLQMTTDAAQGVRSLIISLWHQ